ncbi:hypothetical protein HanRHA438_Chr01g0006991 [Helianthus annuus]|nr:hypothetical protein HanRHA438_Chr01g0006991 [Helianthus annuus]
MLVVPRAWTVSGDLCFISGGAGGGGGDFFITDDAPIRNLSSGVELAVIERKTFFPTIDDDGVAMMAEGRFLNLQPHILLP